jgi:hypothetical protein
MAKVPTSPDYHDLPAEVRDAVLSLIHPMQLDREDYQDLCRGRLGRLCGPGSPNPDQRVYRLGLLAAVEGRGF